MGALRQSFSSSLASGVSKPGPVKGGSKRLFRDDQGIAR